jgi:UDP-N-acetylglucosamine 2-epimerase (non-hydrolysing)
VKAIAPPLSIVAILGTRPEAIKLAPVISELSADPAFSVLIAVTGQHRQMLDQTLKVFGLTPQYDLAVMQPGQSLAELTARLLPPLDAVIAAEAPAAVLVQGDTTTAFVAALAAFYRGVPVAHVEAGLRTHNRYAPFPEESNRRLIGALATWHFAPTAQARMELLREGVADADIAVTGNTVIDALRSVLANTTSPPSPIAPRARLLLVTAHRRENFVHLEAICRALLRLVDAYPDLAIAYPVHLNPRVQEPVNRLLTGHPRIYLLPPLDYVAFIHLLERADIVLTDSGGIQEEGPALGKPVLVMRDVTERPEAIAAGTVELVGTEENRIVARVSRLLDDPDAYAAMARRTSPYGDGQASRRIVDYLRSRLLTTPNS